MEFLQLKYFQTVAKYQHITQAAKALHISQPSLSIMISRLENELGVPLFIRKGRNIELSIFGKSFLKNINRLFIEWENAKQELQNLAEIENKKIVLSTTSPIFLSGLLKNFLNLHPETIFQQRLNSIYEIKENLLTGQIDLGISAFPINEPQIENTLLLSDEVFLAVPSNHKFANCTSVALEDALKQPLILPSKGSIARDYTDFLFDTLNFVPNIVFEGDPTLIKDLVESNYGISFATNFFHQIAPIPSIQLIRLQEPIYLPINLCNLKDRILSSAAETFRSFTIKHYKELSKRTSA